MDRAKAVLSNTEESLRNLLSEAANSGDYISVMRIAEWARVISNLTRDNRTNEQVSAPRARPKPTKTPSRSNIVRGQLRAMARAKQKHYPRFFRQGDHLVRVAWSNRDKEEYHHKASYDVLISLVSLIAEKGKDGRIFSTDELLPLRNHTNGAEVPNYQAYVGISLLKQAGLIDQHGRQGYSIPKIARFREAVEALWSGLPQE